jgi:hypothetical protein
MYQLFLSKFPGCIEPVIRYGFSQMVRAPYIALGCLSFHVIHCFVRRIGRRVADVLLASAGQSSAVQATLELSSAT